MKIENISGELLKKNIKPSYQRIKIFEYLISSKNHPNVDQIFNDLVKDIPTLSKATIYNTLNLFESSGCAKVITIEENETRYDADVAEHGHFKCEKCGAIYDFMVNLDRIIPDDESTLENFRINEKNIYFKGICHKCLNINKKTGGENGGNKRKQDAFDR